MSFLFPRAHLAGLTLSTTASVRTFTVAAGQCADSTNTAIINFPAAMTKSSAAFVAGTTHGALDTGAVAQNTWYHVHLISDAVGANSDVLVSLSASAPTLPPGFTLFRRIGSMLTDVSFNWVLFQQIGDHFMFPAPVNDVALASHTGTRTLNTLSTPLGVKVQAKIRGHVTASSGLPGVLIADPDELWVAGTIAGNYTTLIQIVGNFTPTGEIIVRTDTSSRIAISATSALSGVYVSTYGWIDRRGRDD